MSSHAERYLKFIEDIEREELELDSAAHNTHLSNVQQIAYQKKLRRCTLAHRTYLPLVKMGLMTVSDSVHEVSLGHVARPLLDDF